MVVDHNGSERHKRYKSRVANICRGRGFTVFGDKDDEIPIRCLPCAPPYYVDICAVSSEGILIVEIDGYQGHKSRRGILKDKNRSNEILEYFKDKRVNTRIHRLAFWQLKGMDDGTIIQELQI